MERRTLLAAAGTLAVAGCLSAFDGTGPAAETPSAVDSDAPPAKATATPVRRTADGVAATFEVLAGHHPTETPRPVTASFEGSRVVVTGLIDPANCREPVLRSVTYDESTRTVRLVVGTEPQFGATATVVCDDATYGYRCSASVADGPPAAVEVVHELHGRDDRTFVREAG